MSGRWRPSGLGLWVGVALAVGCGGVARPARSMTRVGDGLGNPRARLFGQRSHLQPLWSSITAVETNRIDPDDDGQWEALVAAQVMAGKREDGQISLSAMEKILRERLLNTAGLRGTKRRKTWSNVAFLVPIMSLLAFFLAPRIMIALEPIFHMDSLVDEGVASTLINGILMPSIGLLLGTLTSLTTGILWNRQKDIRETLNTETNIMDMLVTSFGKLFAGDPTRHLEALTVVRDYMYCVTGESSPRFTSDEKQRIFDATNRKSLQLLEICVLDIADSKLLEADFTFGSPDRARRIVDFCKGLIDQLNVTRARRRTLVETSFPTAHYFLLLSLELCILSAFYLESTATGNVAFFLALKTRAIVSIATAIFTAIPTLLLDLDDPFSGNYQIGNDLMIGSTMSLLLEERERALYKLNFVIDQRVPTEEFENSNRFGDLPGSEAVLTRTKDVELIGPDRRYRIRRLLRQRGQAGPE